MSQEIIEIEKKNIKRFTQVRAFSTGQLEDADTVLKYRERMNSGEEFPPLSVIEDTNKEDTYYLVDGYHRYAALDDSHHDKMSCVVIGTGDEYTALWLSAGANAKNGLQMSNKDIRHAIRMLLDSFPDKNPKEIAKLVGCGKSTVYDVKKAMEVLDSSRDYSTAMERVKHYLDDRPDSKNYSNRQIARECGVSEKTVRNYFASCSNSENSAPKQVPLKCDACGKVHSDPSKMLHVDVINHGEKIATRHVCDATCASKFKWDGCHFSRVKCQITDEKEVCAHCGKKLDKYVTVGLDNINNQLVGFCNHNCAEAYAKKINGAYVHGGCDPFLHYECRIDATNDDKPVPDSVTINQDEFKKLSEISRKMKEYTEKSENKNPKFSCACCGQTIEKQPFQVWSQSNKTKMGKVYRFCDVECAKIFAHDNDVVYDIVDDNDIFKDKDGLDPESVVYKLHEDTPLVEDKTHLWELLPQKEDKEDYDSQSRPSLLKVTKDSQRVKPEIEKPTMRTIKCIPLENPDNIQQVAIDIIKWLGDRKDAFRVVFNDTCDRGKDEIPW